MQYGCSANPYCEAILHICRDHRKLGQELELFALEPETAGGGLVFWHPNGAAIRNILETFWRVRITLSNIQAFDHAPSQDEVAASYVCADSLLENFAWPLTCVLEKVLHLLAGGT